LFDNAAGNTAPDMFADGCPRFPCFGFKGVVLGCGHFDAHPVRVLFAQPFGWPAGFVPVFHFLRFFMETSGMKIGFWYDQNINLLPHLSQILLPLKLGMENGN
jgi:hypothetical protein